MALIFQVRGNALNAWYSSASNSAQQVLGSGASTIVTATDSGTNILNSSIIQKVDSTHTRALNYPGFANWSSQKAFSIVYRIVPRWSGQPAAAQGYFLFNGPFNGSATGPGISVAQTTAGKIQVFTQDNSWTNLINSTGTVVSTATSGTAEEWVFVWDGTASASSFVIYKNGSSFDTITPAAGLTTRNNMLTNGLVFGLSLPGATGNYDINELAIYDTALTSGDVSTLWARSDWISSSTFNGASYTDPGASNVQTGTSYTFAGVSETGTYDGSNRWSDPGVSFVFTGITYKANSLTNNRTGTMDIGSSVWSATRSSYTDTSQFGGFVNKLLSVAKFLGLK